MKKAVITERKYDSELIPILKGFPLTVSADKVPKLAISRKEIGQGWNSSQDAITVFNQVKALTEALEVLDGPGHTKGWIRLVVQKDERRASSLGQSQTETMNNSKTQIRRNWMKKFGRFLAGFAIHVLRERGSSPIHKKCLFRQKINHNLAFNGNLPTYFLVKCFVSNLVHFKG